MKRTEAILAALALLALTARMFHLPGSGILLVLALSSVSIMYLYVGFALFNDIRSEDVLRKESYTDISRKRIVGAVGTGLSLSIAIIGILFKVQSWPGADIQLEIGLFGLLVVTVISLIRIRKGKGDYYLNILKRVAVIGLIVILLLLFR